MFQWTSRHVLALTALANFAEHRLRQTYDIVAQSFGKRTFNLNPGHIHHLFLCHPFCFQLSRQMLLIPPWTLGLVAEELLEWWVLSPVYWWYYPEMGHVEVTNRASPAGFSPCIHKIKHNFFISESRSCKRLDRRFTKAFFTILRFQYLSTPSCWDTPACFCCLLAGEDSYLLLAAPQCNHLRVKEPNLLVFDYCLFCPFLAFSKIWFGFIGWQKASIWWIGGFSRM